MIGRATSSLIFSPPHTNFLARRVIGLLGLPMDHLVDIGVAVFAVIDSLEPQA
jgi:hypothetical protein